MKLRAALGSLALIGCITACTPSTSERPGAASGGEQGSGQAGDGWTLPRPAARPVTFSEFAGGQTLTPTGEDLVLWGATTAHGVDVAGGEYTWDVDLPGSICAASLAANAAGLIAVATGQEGDSDCRTVSLLNSHDGSVLWTIDTPRPRDFAGDAVSTGEQVVVVTDSCGGHVALNLADGDVASEYVKEEVAGECPSAASDGDMIVLSENSEFQILDAATGEQTRPALSGPHATISTIVSREPLVVSGRVWDSPRSDAPGSLLAVGPQRVRAFGRRITRSWAGRPTRFVSVDGTLWIGHPSNPDQPIRPDGSIPEGTFPFMANPVGYDLRTHEEVGAVAIGGSASNRNNIVGSNANDVVLAVDGEIRVGPARDIDNYETVATAGFEAVVVGDWIVSIDGTDLRATRLPRG